ncbi:FecR family protein [Chitinophaga sp. GCM10012297]|uniref:FecR domain-containing protein n=1 Tax=Chitinophaga chungangae TaxID=2821488 RepID=A0ABS3YHD0_9BACT|nr:FecR domain-containing protein [Chitinophaga chungangae]MBO9153489.1 FecR domain-containing protein [Chitinophaga chungangae]
MPQNNLEYYIDRFAQGTISKEEWEILQDLLRQPENSAALDEILKEQLEQFAAAPAIYPDVVKRVQEGVAAQISREKAVPMRPVPGVHFLRRWGWAAASIILIAAIGAYFLTARKKDLQPPLITANTMDVVPGKTGAILTLADGTTILLDSAANGRLATQQGSQVVKKDGQIVYTPGGDEGVAAYNTLRTPRGRMYQVTLPDGTKAWLNAASSISYPVVFSGSERVVAITGEVYFEVAPHAQMPFRVKLNETGSVEVLGTHFNIKAYEEEELVSTTLLEGAVRVAGNGKKVILKPGQQAQVSSKQLSVKTLGQQGISEAMAWKEGRFNFQDADLQDIMRQLSRWYDIEVVYENGIPDLEFIGGMERSLPLSEVLKGLKMSGVNFRLENGRRLIVSP